VSGRARLCASRVIFDAFGAVVGWSMSTIPRKRRSLARSVAFGRTIQTPKLGARIMRYELTDYEWVAIKRTAEQLYLKADARSL
jgi:hypothetical protein